MRKNKEFCKFILFDLLSKSGTTSGIVTLSAEDMEVFKNKDHGWIKIYQISMIFAIFVCYYLITIKDRVKYKYVIWYT